MSSNAELIIKIGGNAEKYRKELKGIEKQTDASVARMQKRARIAAAGFATAAAGGILAFDKFASFENDFSNVVTLLDDSSFKTKTLTAGIGDLKDGVLALRASSGESFENLNKGLFDLISAGVAAEDAIGVLAVATDLAKAGATNTSVAVDGLTSSLNAYGLEGDRAREVSELFFTAQKFGKTTIEELSNGIGQVAPTAAAFGVSMNEVLASVSATTLAGVKTSEAYTGLKATFSNIIKPTKDAADEAERLGIFFDAAALREKGLKGFLDEITQSANFNKDSLSRLFGSVEALNVVLALTGGQAGDFENILSNLGDETGRAENLTNALAAKTETAQDKINRMKGATEAATVALGEFIAPSVIFFMETTAREIGNLINGFEALGSVIGGVSTIIQESLSSAFAFILSGFNQVKAQIAGFVAGVNGAAAKLPFIGEENRERFELNAAQALLKQKEFNIQSEALAIEAVRFFTDAEAEKNLSLSDSLKSQRELQAEHDAINAQGDAINREAELERLEALRQEDLEREMEQFEEDQERKAEQDALDEQRKEAARKKSTENDKKAAKEREKIEKQIEKGKGDRVKAEEQLDQAIVDSAFSALQSIVGDNKAAQTALFLAEKGVAISKIIMNAQQAASLAIATIPPPAGEAIAAQRIAMGNIQAGIVAATALPQLIGTIGGAQQGGMVGGGFGGGDKHLMALEAGELVVPKQIAPNFIDMVANAPFEESGGGSQSQVIIGFQEEASRYITVQQREDRILGVSR